ncbi:L,D-transpeptidase [Actinomadura rupiterrae]|uniref:L,D-transpeptidase n=1 Tax=Actinomadura rupiterrae TaxID=559627 RepID=UPI0020A482FC|nr:L,D-transpeptidase [Actinomadura rupiterrae]MCP2335862.1 lipoprotein-anchoring transpeptidase ErfK/SrfK [Actinomadura rupiterrae]
MPYRHALAVPVRTVAALAVPLLALGGCGGGPGPAGSVATPAAAPTGDGSTPSTPDLKEMRAATFRVAAVTPREGEVVGVGMPIIVTFSRAVSSRAKVERALRVRMSRAVPGGWFWPSPRQAVFRPRRFWPSGERITLDARTSGLRDASGVSGEGNVTRTFRVGRARVSIVDTRAHRMSVSEDGRVVRRTPISAGRGGRRAYTTTSGVHLVMGKGDPVVMSSAWMGVTNPEDPRYYKMRVRYAVQISASGEYVHSAPWSVASQGHENVSHGCVNASPDFARWFYGRSVRGDVVLVTGTSRPLAWNNGYGYWQLPWTRWKAASAR